MIVDNLVHFSRVLRRAGLQVGSDRVLSAVAAVEAVGVQRREDLHAALSAVMLDRHEQQAIFDAAFDAFFRDPKLLERLMYLMLPKVTGRGEKDRAAQAQRLAEALSAPREKPERPAAADNPHDEVQFDTTFSFSERERLQRADFESMTTAEYALARALAERLPPPVEPVWRRRHEAATAGTTIDLRRTLQRMVRAPHALAPVCTQPRRELPPIVVLLDISGSMDRYARLFLHYLHGLVRRHVRVQVFTFGTRLTNVSRALRHRDPDAALRAAEEQVSDWKGGTRIGACLDTFNRRWARRVLGANAAVLLVTDGLDRDDQGALAQAAEQLHRLGHEVVWLNPLLRFDGFEPRAAGVRALLPHVDRFLPVHNLASLADLGRALRAPALRPATLLRPRARA